jgi:membrane protease YdiL (CAAX protease family)
LFFTGSIPVSDVVFILAASVVFAWLVVGTGGSVLLPMIMHAANNAISGEYISPMFSGTDGVVLGWVRAGIWILFALAVVLTNKRRLMTNPS